MSLLRRAIGALSPFRPLVATGIVAAFFSAMASEQSTNASLPTAAFEARKNAAPPPVFQVPERGGNIRVDDAELFGFEQAARQMFGGRDAPDEVFLLSSSLSSIILWDPPQVIDPRSLTVLAIKGNTGTLRLKTEYGEKSLDGM